LALLVNGIPFLTTDHFRNPSKDGKMLPAWFLDFKRPVTYKGVYQPLGRVLPDAAGYPILEV